MQLSRINLNLLVVLNALLTEKHVTRAGKKIFLAQSTVSCALQQLRELFQDELLVRDGKKLTLTPRAHELAPQIRQFLLDAEKLVTNIGFNPKTSDRIFTLSMTEYANMLITPLLYDYLQEYAPNIKLKIKLLPPLNGRKVLKDEEIDLAFGIMPKLNPARDELLFKDEMVCVGRANHPLLKRSLTLKDYLKAEHLSLVMNHNEESILFDVDNLLTPLGHTRNVVVRMNDTLPAFALLASSNLLGLFPKGLVEIAKRYFKLTIQKAPFNYPSITFAQIWHPRFDNDAGHIWLRTLIKNKINIHRQRK